MPLTIKEIARLAGTSLAAVSLVLNNKDAKRVGPKKRQAILEVVRKHTYRQHTGARGLKLGKTFQAALCLHGTIDEYPIIGRYGTYKALGFASRYLQESGYGIHIVQIDPQTPVRAIAQNLSNLSVDGFIFIKWGSHAELLARIMFLLDEQQIPVVALDAPLDPGLTWTAVDHATAYYQSTRYLIGRGFSRIALLHADAGPAIYRDYQRAMDEQGLKYIQKNLHSVAAGEIRAGAQSILSACPDLQAVMLTDTYYAPFVIDLFGPKSITMLAHGEEDFLTVNNLVIPYFKAPTAALSKTTVDLLLERMREGTDFRPRQVLLPCERVNC